jgi:hypothetical protein
MKIYIVLILFLNFQVWATAQSPDILIYEGERYSLVSFPLEKYFMNNEELRPFSKIISSANR